MQMPLDPAATKTLDLLDLMVVKSQYTEERLLCLAEAVLATCQKPASILAIRKISDSLN